MPVFQKCTPLAVVGAMELLNAANRLHQEITGTEKVLFRVELVSMWDKTVIGSHQYPVYCHRLASEVSRTDMVLLPSLDSNVEANLKLNYAYCDWILGLKDRGAEVASMCTGAFMLAETGLLDGRKATTHWYFEPLFRQLFPDVELLPGHLIIEDDGVYTCGGTNSYLNLMIYFIEKFGGRETAVFAAKMFMVDYDRHSQKQYSIFSVQKHHKDDTILAAQKFMEENFNRGISIDDVVGAVNTSKRTFIRRFKSATGNTPLEYLQRIKIEWVKKKLETGSEPISEIIYAVGYSDASAFRQVFRKHTGLSPIAYRKKYQHRLIMV